MKLKIDVLENEEYNRLLFRCNNCYHIHKGLTCTCCNSMDCELLPKTHVEYSQRCESCLKSTTERIHVKMSYRVKKVCWECARRYYFSKLGNYTRMLIKLEI